METFIQNYRGFSIKFNPDTEKFICVVSDESSKESKSFAAVKKFIDDYKKANANFVPFYIVTIPHTYGDDRKRLKVVGKRKDNGWVVTENDGEPFKLSIYDISKFMVEKEENKDLLQNIYQTIDDYHAYYRFYENNVKKKIEELNVVKLSDL